MSRKNKNREGYKETKVGWIPKDWELKWLYKIATINDEILPENTPDDYKFFYITLSDVTQGRFTIPRNKISFKDSPSRARRIFRKGDILLSTVRPNLKGFGIVKFESNNFICSTGFAVIRPNEKSDVKFIYYFLNSHETAKYFYTCVIGSNYPALNNNEIERLKLPFPPLPEQQKIAEILKTWDKAIELVEKQIEAKEQLKRGVMQQLLTGKMRFPEFGKNTVGNKRPEGWYEKKLKDLFNPVKRKNSKGLKRVLTVSGEYGLIDQIEFFNKSVAGKDLSGYYLLKQGEFAYNRSAMNSYPYGAIKRLDQYKEGISSTLYICFSLKKEIKINSDFYKYYFEVGCLNRQLRIITHVGGRAHGLLNITNSDFMNVQLMVPSLEEQEKIAKVLHIFSREIELLKAYKCDLKKQKRGLMQKLLTGEVRVKN